MYPISFPNFNLTFHIDPVAIEIGDLQIYWYGILIATGIMLALWICKKNEGLFGISFDTVMEFSFIAILVGILCARLYYVIFSWDYYATHLADIFKIYQRWTCNLRWHLRRNGSRNHLLLHQKNLLFGFGGFWHAGDSFSTIHWKMGKFC